MRFTSLACLLALIFGCNSIPVTSNPTDESVGNRTLNTPIDQDVELGVRKPPPIHLMTVQAGWPISQLYQDLGVCWPEAIAFMSTYDKSNGCLLTYYEQDVTANGTAYWTIVLIDGGRVSTVQRYQTKIIEAK